MMSKSNLIYFENNRSTVPDPVVIDAMRAYNDETNFSETFTHTRQCLAKLIGAQANELHLTAGISQSIVIGIELLYKANQHKGRHIIVSKTEHQVVLDTCSKLEQEGAEISYLTIDPEGMINMDEIKSLIRADTNLVCLMAANNQTGVLNPVDEVTALCAAKGVLLFCDASQFVGKARCEVHELGVDGMAFGSHKMYGPEGIGALYIKEALVARSPALAVELQNLNAGFLTNKSNAALMIGFAKAAQIAGEQYWENSAHISRLKNYFEHQLLDIEGLRINGSTRHRLFNTSNLYFPDGDKLQVLLKKYDVLSYYKKSSHVLLAMGLSEDEIHHCFRFSFGKYNTVEEVKELLGDIFHYLKN